VTRKSVKTIKRAVKPKFKKHNKTVWKIVISLTTLKNVSRMYRLMHKKSGAPTWLT